VAKQELKGPNSGKSSDQGSPQTTVQARYQSRPPKLEWAANRLSERRDLCRHRARDHDKKAVFWQQWATPLVWLTAVLAGLSGVTVVAEADLAAIILSVATALVAASNAALQPIENAKSHRAASVSYERLARKLDDTLILDMSGWEDGREMDPGSVEPTRVRIQELEEELNAIEQSHPPLSVAGARKRPSFWSRLFSLGRRADRK
jgi:hypothetical protein